MNVKSKTNKMGGASSPMTLILLVTFVNEISFTNTDEKAFVTAT